MPPASRDRYSLCLNVLSFPLATQREYLAAAGYSQLAIWTLNQIRTKSVNTGFGRAKEVVEERQCPTPLASPLSQKLERLLNANEGGDKGSPFDFANILQQKLVELLRSAPSTRDFTSENEEMWFNKLRKDSAELQNIHSARAFLYGAAHLGPKTWYKKIAEM